MKKNKKNESGRSIIEMLGVLALLMLLTLGGLQLFGQMQAGVVAKDLSGAIVEEALIRQHALKGKPSNKKDTISRQGPHGISFEIENGVDGDMGDYFWVKTNALSQEVCEALLKKAQELQNGENNNNLGLLAVMDEDGKRVTSCTSKEKKQIPSLQYLFQKNPGYHLHGLYPWWIPQKEGEEEGTEVCEERVMPNGGFIDNEQLECHAGYYKTGTGCDVTCKVCPGNTISDEKATECVDCEEGTQANETHTECVCHQVGKSCIGEHGKKGLYDENCNCIEGACINNNDCEEGERCPNEDTCQECEVGDHCCEEPKPYWGGVSCVECTQDSHCGENQYCNNYQCEEACKNDATYNKETHKCICNEPTYHGSYNRGSASTCYTCQDDTPKWNGTACVACLEDSDCNDDEFCSTENACQKVCNGFTKNVCTTECKGERHKAWYTVLDRVTDKPLLVCPKGSCTSDGYCPEPVEATCQDGYWMNADGDCVNECTGFTGTQCRTACTPDEAGKAQFTNAPATTECGNNARCDGQGACVCLYGGTQPSNCYTCKPNTTDGCTNGRICNSSGTTCYCPSGKVIINGICQDCPANAACSGNDATTFTCTANYYENGNVCSACTGSGLIKSGTVQVCPNKCFRTFSGDKDNDGRLYGTVSGNGGSKTWTGDIAWGRCQKDDFWCPGHNVTKPFTFNKTSNASSASGWVIINTPPGYPTNSSSARWTCTGTNDASPKTQD